MYAHALCSGRRQQQLTQCGAAVAGVKDPHLTLELALFTALFPTGVGHYTGSSLPEYLLLRMRCLFSVWTLYKPYLLLMYQIRQCMVVATQCSAMVLERSALQYKKDHPGSTEQVCVQACECVWQPAHACN